MNKLIIVGNGFDLAHGLPTSYTHFIDDFWKNIKDNFLKKEIKKVVFINESYLGWVLKIDFFSFLKQQESFFIF